jgi:3-methyladenine DNA glycosylase Tag
MPRSGPEGVDPREIFPFEFGVTPEDERAYLEMLSWFVFGAGPNWRVLKSKWPNFRKAFADFDPKKVAKFNEADVDRLLADTGIIRNGKKITGTVENARTLIEIGANGGMTAWLLSYGVDADALIKDTKKRFRHMGDVTTRMFLSAAGAIEYPTWQATEGQRGGRP